MGAHQHPPDTKRTACQLQQRQQRPPLAWDAYDYDSIWTVTIDGGGNLAANNSLCEGIDSENLPATAPQF